MNLDEPPTPSCQQCQHLKDDKDTISHTLQITLEDPATSPPPGKMYFLQCVLFVLISSSFKLVLCSFVILS